MVINNISISTQKYKTCEGTYIYMYAFIDPEIYFDSNQVCLIALPSPRVYEALSYTILAKNSSYSNPQVLNDTAYQEIPIVEVLLTRRWRNFIKKPFYIILSTPILFYIFYTVAILFPEEIFGYTPGSSIQHTRHLVCLIIALLTWILFFLQEIKQMIDLTGKYWKSIYNYIDLLAGIFPLVTFILLVTDSPHLVSSYIFTKVDVFIHFLKPFMSNCFFYSMTLVHLQP
jgi:ABC-type transport system substrate-binding protein